MPGSVRELTVYVGCYTTPNRNGRGEGISAYRMDKDSGEWRPLGVVAKAPNPSFLALHPGGQVLYCVHGGNLSEVSAFRITDSHSGALSPLNTVSSGGVNPVHLSVHPSGKCLVVANYTGGTASVLPINDDGSLQPPGNTIPLEGPCGPDPVEQNTPHPHDIPFHPTGAFVAIPDKGLDRVFVFRVSGTFVPANPPYAVSAPGAGPRHIAFHPSKPWAYTINELNSTVTVYTYQPNGDGLCELQTVSSVPSAASTNGRTTGSEIVVHPTGEFVYASNRGHDSVAAFSIDQQSGEVTPIDWYSTRGKTPRSIELEPAGHYLYAANQDSDTIMTFRVDPSSGALHETGQVIESKSPVTMVFTEAGE